MSGRRSPVAFADLNLDQSPSLLGLETPRTLQDPVPLAEACETV
jgi:hypothetical protein